MGILGIVLRNVLRPPRTRRPDDMPPAPAGFRGMIEHEASLCTGCRACAYVCAPRCISFDSDERGVTWKFFAGQCSFCGLCAQYCSTGAITTRNTPPAVTGDPARHRVAHAVPYRPCARCSRPIIPLPEAVLQRLYRGALTEARIAEQELCESCRRKLASRNLCDAYLEKRSD